MADTVVEELREAGADAVGVELVVTGPETVEMFVDGVANEFDGIDTVVEDVGDDDGPIASTYADTLPNTFTRRSNRTST